uniref:C-type lectin domain-containing protein n=1 Tax=Heterorhabditis bacteriophora TaxID=37862 RepID=A0A1I7WQ94_HETBA
MRFEVYIFGRTSGNVINETVASCDENWTFNSRLHSCYLAPHHPLTWYEAQKYCKTFGGNLVSVLTSKESKAVQGCTI